MPYSSRGERVVRRVDVARGPRRRPHPRVARRAPRGPTRSRTGVVEAHDKGRGERIVLPAADDARRGADDEMPDALHEAKRLAQRTRRAVKVDL